MLRKNVSWRAFICRSTLLCLFVGCVVSLESCDRGASTEVEAAREFADAVTRNEAARRDSMIATYKYREYFNNPYVASDMLSWFRTFYDYQEKHFKSEAVADVDRNLNNELKDALIDTSGIEETGMVKVKAPVPGEDAAYFWMVKQHGRPWKVAIVTKGEMQVNFH